MRQFHKCKFNLFKKIFVCILNFEVKVSIIAIIFQQHNNNLPKISTSQHPDFSKQRKKIL